MQLLAIRRCGLTAAPAHTPRDVGGHLSASRAELSEDRNAGPRGEFDQAHRGCGHVDALLVPQFEDQRGRSLKRPPGWRGIRGEDQQCGAGGRPEISRGPKNRCDRLVAGERVECADALMRADLELDGANRHASVCDAIAHGHLFAIGTILMANALALLQGMK